MLRPLFYSAIVALLAACSVLPPAPPAPILHDLGVSSGVQPAVPSCDPILTVSAPDWLNDGAIFYRPTLDTRLAVYRDHRWVAPPSALLSERIRTLLGTSKGEQARCSLTVSITTFEQRFNADGSATAMIVARVQFAASPGALPVASTVLVLTEPSLTPDVQGGVQSLATTMNALAEQVVAWIPTAGGDVDID